MAKFEKDVQSFFKKLIKSNRPVKINGNVNIGDKKTDKTKKAEDERKQRKLFDGVGSSLSKKMENVVKPLSDAANKTPETLYDVFTSTSPFGQALGLFNDTLKGLGLDTGKIFGGIKDLFKGKSRKKIQKEEDTVVSKVEETTMKTNDQLDSLLILTRDLVKTNEEQLLEQKSTEKERLQNEKTQARLGKIKDRKIKRDKKVGTIKAKRDKGRRTKKKRPLPLKAISKVAAGALGLGLLASDFLGGGGLEAFQKGDIGGGIKKTIFGKVPEFYQRTETGEFARDTSGKLIERKGSTKESVGFLLKQTAKLGALGFLAGGEKGAFAGMLIGAVAAGMQIFWKKFLEPWIETSFKPFIAKITGTFETFKKSRVGKLIGIDKDVTQRNVISESGRSYRFQEYTTGEGISGKVVTETGEEIGRRDVIKKEREQIFGKKFSELRDALKTSSTMDEKRLVDEYTTILSEFRKTGLISVKEEGKELDRIRKEIEGLRKDKQISDNNVDVLRDILNELKRSNEKQQTKDESKKEPRNIPGINMIMGVFNK